MKFKSCLLTSIDQNVNRPKCKCADHPVVVRGGPKKMTGGYFVTFNSGDSFSKSECHMSYSIIFTEIIFYPESSIPLHKLQLTEMQKLLNVE